MKILYIVSRLGSTGPTNQLYGIIHNLDREKFTPYILTLSNESEESYKKKFEDDNVEIETLGLSRIASIFVGKRNLKKALKRIAPDLIHTSGLRPDIMMGQIKINIPLCSTLRNYVYENYISRYGKIKGGLICLCHENSIKKMQYPICCSKTLQKKYAAHLKMRFFAIQNGVDMQHYYVKSTNERLQIKQNLKLPIDKKIIIVVGSLLKLKDPITIINAVERLPKKENFQLVFIGKGELWEELQKYQSDYIRFLGYKNNVFEYFQAADLFISASKTEGLPNTVLEAGACGLPMILSDIPQHREIFEADIQGIKYFSVGDTNMLTELIQHFFNGGEKYSRTIISDYVKERFDSRVMSQNYQKFYKVIY
ncbi:MAG: glycosyltransferase [Roseburia sp.]|nr:glycosyltransferase [Roseburia sp.]